MTVFVVTEHEPESDYPEVVDQLYATKALADDAVERYERERDSLGEKTADDIWWEVTGYTVNDE